MGVDVDLFDIISWDSGDFSVSCVLNFKVSKTTFRLFAVYGSPYEEGKDEFICELHSLFLENALPTLIGGDFNLVRFQQWQS